jgi:hypothetical protein
MSQTQLSSKSTLEEIEKALVNLTNKRPSILLKEKYDSLKTMRLSAFLKSNINSNGITWAEYIDILYK